MTDKKLPEAGILAQILQPRMLLIIWMWLGGLFLAWVLVSSMIPKNKPGPAEVVDRSYITGEMRDFELAILPRGTPYTEFEGPDGTTTLSDFRGKVVLVNLWATWCAPCLEELPWLDGLNAELGGEDFEVVAIAVEPRVKERAAAFLERLEVKTLDIYTDESMQFAFSMGGVDVLPLSILYDAKGNEIGRLTGGADWESPEAKALIQAVIDGQKISS
jgi:thiol-disulfide isomerase/thioredoxin